MRYHAWCLAAIIVLAVTAVAWLIWPDSSGYVGGAAWFLLLFLPAIGLRKITQLAAQGDYKSAGRLGAALQILHPTAELREQARLFRQSKSNAAHPRAFSSIPADHNIAASARRSELRSPPAVLILILVNVLVFLFELSVGDWNDPGVLHRIGGARAGCGNYARRVLASVHCAFSTCRIFASRVQPVCVVCSWTAAGAHHRHIAICGVLFIFRPRVRCRRGCSGQSRACSSRPTDRRVRLRHGRGRCVGWIFIATSSCAIRETAARKHRPDRSDPDRIRSFHAAGQHGRAYVWIGCRIFSWANPRDATRVASSVFPQ